MTRAGDAAVPGPRAGAGRERGAPPLWAALTVGALLLALGFAHIRYLWFVGDDAYISFRYAANLSRGLGLVYNAGERVEGYTNFLWTLLAAGVIRLGGRPEAWMPAVSAGCALLTLALVMAASRRRGRDPLFAGAFLASSSGFAAWATGGLETALFTLLVTAAFLVLREALEPQAAEVAQAVEAAQAGSPPPGRAARPRALLASAWLLGLAALTRPEGWLVSLAAAAFLLVLVLRRRLERRGLLPAAALWLGCVLPHLLWRLVYYGRLLPNSFAVKSPGASQFLAGAHYLLLAAGELCLYPLLMLLLAGLLLPEAQGARGREAGPLPPGTRGARGREAGLLAAFMVPYLLFVSATGGDFMPLFRYVAPLLPLLALTAGEALDRLTAPLSGRLLSVAVRVLAYAVLAGFALLNFHGSREHQGAWARGDLESVGLTRRYAEEWGRIGTLLSLVGQPTDTLATTAAGVIPYRSGLPTIDMLGLNARDLSRYRRRETTRPGHALVITGRALDERRPQFLLGDPMIRTAPRGAPLALDVEPEWHERIMAHYKVGGMVLPGTPVLYVCIAVRNDVAERLLRAARERRGAATP